MKILLASDTHGITKNFIEFLDKETFDMLFFLGDYVKDGIEIAKALNIPSKIVRGNGDRNVIGYEDDEILTLEGKKIFLTHGHNYNVSSGLDQLFYKGKELGADYVFFGHTHIPIIEKHEDIIIMNPGSPSLPRTADLQRTFGILELGEHSSEKIIKIK